MHKTKFLELTIKTTDIFMQKVKQLKEVFIGVECFALQHKGPNNIRVIIYSAFEIFQNVNVFSTKVSTGVMKERGNRTLQKSLKIVNHFPRHFLDLKGN